MMFASCGDKSTMFSFNLMSELAVNCAAPTPAPVTTTPVAERTEENVKPAPETLSQPKVKAAPAPPQVVAQQKPVLTLNPVPVVAPPTPVALKTYNEVTGRVIENQPAPVAPVPVGPDSNA